MMHPKLMFHIVISFLLLASVGIQAQVKSRNITFDGTIGKLPVIVTLELGVSQTTIGGEYVYVKNKDTKNRMSLNGQIIDGSMLLREQYYSSNGFQTSGFLSGTLAKNYTVSGIWTDTELKKVLPLKLTPRAKYLHRDLTFKPITDKSEYNNYNTIEGVEISNVASGAIVQTITGLGKDIQKNENPLTLTDLNFDGYLDLVIDYIYPEATKNDWGQYYFLYNPATDQFERNTTLEDFQVAMIDPIAKTICDYLYADGRGNEAWDTYVYQNGKYLMIKHEEAKENDNTLYFIEYKIVNGASVEQKRNYPK